MRHKQRVGSTVALASLARDLQVSTHTVKHWLQILEDLFVVFPVRPYHRNISRSLLKESKYYFFDTGNVLENQAARLENVVATALLAELNFLEDTTGIHGELCFLRDKEKREVDFLVLIDQKPRWMIEVKLSEEQFSKHLFYFRRFLKDVHGVQLVHQLKRRKTQNGVDMLSVEDFLAELYLNPE